MELNCASVKALVKFSCSLAFWDSQIPTDQFGILTQYI